MNNILQHAEFLVMMLMLLCGAAMIFEGAYGIITRDDSRREILVRWMGFTAVLIGVLSITGYAL